MTDNPSNLPEGGDASIALSLTERNVLLHWKANAEIRGKRYIVEKAAFADEERLIRRLKAHFGGDFRLGQKALKILRAWAEAAAGRAFGVNNAVVNNVEETILQKIQEAYTALNPEFQKTAFFPSAKRFHKKRKRKHIVWRLYITLALFLAIVLVLAVPGLRKPRKEKEPMSGGSQRYKILFLEGTVLRKADDQWIPAKMNTRFTSGDSFRVMSASSMELLRNGKAHVFREETQGRLD